MAKYRSLIDFAAIVAGNREGINLGIDAAIFVRREAIERTFERPRIGTQGKSLGAVTASTDISAGTDTSIKIAVDGGAIVTATIPSVVGLNTGALIAAALELAINTALIADGQDARAWVQFNGAGPDQYTVWSQKTGVATSVVITPAVSNNVADNLKLGVANAGTETVGTDDQDFFLYTTGGIKFTQPIESNPHRSGRFHSGIIKSKKVVDFDFDAMLNMSGSAGASLDAAVRLLLESATGVETVVPGISIDYTQGLPNFTFSVVKASTIFGEYFTGAYVKDWTLTAPGDAPATQKFAGMGSDGSIAGIGQLNGAVVSSANVILNASHAKRFTVGARVMAVDPDGRTILAGFDGTLSVSSVNLMTETVVVSTAVSIPDNGYLVFWHPGAVQATGRDAIYTDLAGSFKFTDSGNTVCATNIELSLTNEHIDLNNCFGDETNQGFAAGNRATWALSVTLDLSNENLGDLVQSRAFGGLDGELIIGTVGSGRYLLVDFSKWIVSVPPIDLPENGTTPVTFDGTLYQSQPGARDPIVISFR
jgi:hypothetical protein